MKKENPNGKKKPRRKAVVVRKRDVKKPRPVKAKAKQTKGGVKKETSNVAVRGSIKGSPKVISSRRATASKRVSTFKKREATRR